MRRVRYYAYGGPEVLQIEDAPSPTPGAGQVLVRPRTIGANFVDTKFRRGGTGIFTRPLPRGLTGDVVGTVEAVGLDVDGALVGKRVAALTEDAFGDLVLADAGWLPEIPDTLDDADASMLASAAPVSLGALRLGRVAPGETVLVHAAAGNIGHITTQLAKLAGATVIGTAGGAAKLDFVRAHGADIAIDYSAPDWVEQVRAAAPGGVDLALDSVGGTTLLQTIDLLAPLGRVVVYGAAGGELTSIPVTSLFGLKSVVGFSILAFRAAAPKQAADELAELVDLFVSGRLHTTVHTRLPMSEIVTAHEILEGRQNLGRVLVTP